MSGKAKNVKRMESVQKYRKQIAKDHPGWHQSHVLKAAHAMNKKKHPELYGSSKHNGHKKK
jgi:hypothetical protein